MYATADLTDNTTAPISEDPIGREIAEIEELRRRALKNRDVLYCSPAVRHLVETEVPRLVVIIQQMRRDGREGASRAASDLWILRALEELRREMELVRELIERR